MADGSCVKPLCTVSETVIVEVTGAAVVHWKFTKPSGPVVLVAVGLVGTGGATQDAGVGDAVAVISQS